MSLVSATNPVNNLVTRMPATSSSASVPLLFMSNSNTKDNVETNLKLTVNSQALKVLLLTLLSSCFLFVSSSCLLFDQVKEVTEVPLDSLMSLVSSLTKQLRVAFVAGRSVLSPSAHFLSFLIFSSIFFLLYFFSPTVDKELSLLSSLVDHIKSVLFQTTELKHMSASARLAYMQKNKTKLTHMETDINEIKDKLNLMKSASNQGLSLVSARLSLSASVPFYWVFSVGLCGL
jgi:hypothetical protein